MRYTEASSLARMFCFHKETNARLGRCSNPEHLAEMPLVRRTQAAALLSVSGRSQRSAAAAQAPGKSDLVRAVEQTAVPVLLVNNLVMSRWYCARRRRCQVGQTLPSPLCQSL